MLLVGGSLLASVAYWLADTGINAPSVAPAPGLPGGKAAELVPVAGSITRPQGQAALQAGVKLARVIVAKGLSNRLKVDAVWLNPRDADQVLNTPHAQIHIGLYVPIHTGACTGLSSTVDEPKVTITDTVPGPGSATYCATRDAQAAGRRVTQGKLMLSETEIGGYLRMGASNASTPACAASGTSWCHPSGLDPDQSVFWVAATIVTPGGKPAGQQNNLDQLDFYLAVSKL